VKPDAHVTDIPKARAALTIQADATTQILVVAPARTSCP